MPSRNRSQRRHRRIPSTRGPSPSRRPLEQALRLLAGRDFTAAELEARLAQAGISSRERAEVLELLAASGYLNDGRVARDRAVRLAQRGYGNAAISADLEGRGVPPEQCAEILGSLEPEAERAEALAARHGRSARTARTLARKGFAEESIERALRSIAQET